MPSDFDDKNNLIPPDSFLEAGNSEEEKKPDPNSFFMDLVNEERKETVESQDTPSDGSDVDEAHHDNATDLESVSVEPNVFFENGGNIQSEENATRQESVDDAVVAHSVPTSTEFEEGEQDYDRLDTVDLPYDSKADFEADLELDVELDGFLEGDIDDAVESGGSFVSDDGDHHAVVTVADDASANGLNLGAVKQQEMAELVQEQEPSIFSAVDSDLNDGAANNSFNSIEENASVKTEEESALDDADGEGVLSLDSNDNLSQSAPYSAPVAEKKSFDDAEEDQIYNLMEETEKGQERAGNKLRIGDELVERGLITQDQLNVALQEKKVSGKMMGTIFVELGFVDQPLLIEFLADEVGVSVFKPSNAEYAPDVVGLISKKNAKVLKALPVRVDGNDYYVAMVDPQDVVALDTLRSYFPVGANLMPLLASSEVLFREIDVAYGYASLVSDILKELEEGQISQDLSELDEKDAFSHPIVRLVNALVFEAVKLGVSDLHFEPEENFVRLRYRLDGVLYTTQTLHKQHWGAISQRLKIMSNMDIADKINPQDGRFRMSVTGREADFRVSSLPTVHGENIVLRVLDKSESIMPMESLGFSAENQRKIKRAQMRPEGIVIVTGPTGSGKTTTLYSMLNEINDVEVNIQTLEDPVEYSLPMIRQTNVRESVLEFADGIKALLRQDPDIIFIGEIRDKVTAEMALKAAMTGHQVYTSLHTNDSFGAIPRLLDLGLKSSMLSGAIVAIFAQRLARRLCGHCKTEFIPNEEERALLGVKFGEDMPKMFNANPAGCKHCSKGYKGRVALVEILSFDSEMDDILAQGGSISELRRVAVNKGFKSMSDDAVLKIKEGITDIAAVSKVVDLTRNS